MTLLCTVESAEYFLTPRSDGSVEVICRAVISADLKDNCYADHVTITLPNKKATELKALSDNIAEVTLIERTDNDPYCIEDESGNGIITDTLRVATQDDPPNITIKFKETMHPGDRMEVCVSWIQEYVYDFKDDVVTFDLGRPTIGGIKPESVTAYWQKDISDTSADANEETAAPEYDVIEEPETISAEYAKSQFRNLNDLKKKSDLPTPETVIPDHEEEEVEIIPLIIVGCAMIAVVAVTVAAVAIRRKKEKREKPE